jgi:predicted alpha/beta-hydrolase family hydrolase
MTYTTRSQFPLSGPRRNRSGMTPRSTRTRLARAWTVERLEERTILSTMLVTGGKLVWGKLGKLVSVQFIPLLDQEKGLTPSVPKQSN